MTDRQSRACATIYWMKIDDIDAVRGRVRVDAGTEHLFLSAAFDAALAYASIDGLMESPQ